MNISDTIANLLNKEGVAQLIIGKTPQGGIFIQAQHPIPTGDTPDCFMNVVHQASDSTLPCALNTIVKQVEHANVLRTTLEKGLIALPPNVRG